MKNSNVVQLKNDFIETENSRIEVKRKENKRRTRFMGMLLVLVVFLFVFPTYNLIESYNNLKEKEQQLVELKNRYESLAEEQKIENELVTKLKDDDYAAKYVRARYQYSKSGEFIYNIPGLLPK